MNIFGYFLIGWRYIYLNIPKRISKNLRDKIDEIFKIV